MGPVQNRSAAPYRWDAVLMSGEAWMHNRWLHGFFAGTMLLTVVIAALAWSPWSTRWPAYVVVAVLVVAYIAYGHRGYDEPRAAAAFLPLVLLGTLVLPAVSPNTAFVQCIAFPLVWVQSERVRTAVLLSVAVAVTSSIGLQISGGPDALVSTLLVEGISVVGTCAIGVWISSVSRLSEDRRQLIDELRATQQSLAEAHRSAGVASERERLAREIHDTVAQNLAGIVMLTERARKDHSSGRGAALDERLSVLEESARAALEDSRSLIAAGVAGATSGSLAGSLHRLAERFTRETGTPATVDATDVPLDRDAQVVLLRVVQESLANIRAHANASAVQIVLHHDHDLERTGVRVTDDGVGFDTGAPTAGHGLRGLRERLMLSGGTCAITSAPGGGTVVDASLPTAAGAALLASPYSVSAVSR